MSTSSTIRTLKAGTAYFALVFAAGFALGMIRVPWLVPRLGERTAELLEMPLMGLVIVLAARFTVRRFALAPAWAPRLQVGFIALGLLGATELLLVVTLQGSSVGQYLASRDPVSGGAYLLMLVVLALMPALLWRFARRRA